jgi:hypothetical protein
LESFHGSHPTTDRGTPCIPALNGGVLRRFSDKCRGGFASSGITL